jgi:hypothetical protein
MGALLRVTRRILNLLSVFNRGKNLDEVVGAVELEALMGSDFD